MSEHHIPEDVKAAMWQFCLRTSVPRLLEKKRREVEAAESADKVEDNAYAQS
ncbi:hypothetical protein [Sporosarcina sp. FSL K6-5500]|uniref:hypothetical protein n=1 Tax=Sporosarcina sp. FSL K6-5500 TaxID=2921558 RepID=UPI0030FBF7EC